jgi:hypothetical protein
MYIIIFLSNLLFTGVADRTCEELTCGNEYCQEQICVKICDYATSFTAEKKGEVIFNGNM